MLKRNRKNGFTLIELIIVIAIIAMIAAIAIPKYKQTKKQAAITAHNANVSMLKTAASVKLNELNSNDLPVTWKGEKDNENDDSLNYVEKWPQVPKGIDELKGKSYTVKIDPQNSTITVDPDEKALK